MAAQVGVAALLQACLSNPLQVEEAHHVGEQAALGIDALGVGLQIEPADAQVADPLGGFGIQLAGEFHP